MSQETLTRAWEILQDAYQAQMEGDYDRAVELYQSSLELHPTAEAYTFLGWTYHFQHYNLGRAYLGKEMYARAMKCFQDALEVEPRYSLARQALASLRRMV